MFITGAEAPDFRFALTDREYVLNGKVYHPVGFSKPQIRASLQDAVSTTSIVLPDVGSELARVLETAEIGGSIIKILQTTPRGILDGHFVQKFEGQVTGLTLDMTTVNFTVSSIAADPNGLWIVPRRTYGVRCEHRFGSEWCTVNEADHQYHGMVGAGSNQIRIVDPGFTREQLLRTWDPSYVKAMTGPNANQARAVSNLIEGSVFLRKPFYSPCLPGDVFILQRHCPRTIDGCVGFSNEGNYGGCKDQPQQPRSITRPPIKT